MPAHLKHGHCSGGKQVRHSRAYRCWNGMKSRCYNLNDPSYHRYGGRGIKVYTQWFQDFMSFLKDMGEPRPGQSLDRINNDGDYTPGNCRWATVSEQARNRNSNRILTAYGVSATIAEWAEALEVPQRNLHTRLAYKWESERVVTQPLRPRSNKT